MNLTKNEIDALNFSITITVEKSDYEEKVNKVLKDYKNKASIDGFRQGKVPFGLIKKKYYTPVLVEEMNKLISESLSKYLQDTEDKILGEPLPNNDEQKPINWGEQDDYEFAYKVAVAPSIEVKLSKKDKFTNYELKVEDKDIEAQLKNYQQNYGEYVESKKVVDSNMITGDIAQSDEKGNVIDGGISADNTSMLMTSFKDEAQKKLFLGKKVNDTITFNPKVSFENEYEIAGLLKAKKEDLKPEDIDCNYNFTISAIKDWVTAENNQELWDKVFGKDEVKSEEEFKTKIAEAIKQSFVPQSNYKFGLDAKEKLVEKVKFDLPEAFLKEWLRATNTQEKLTDEKLEADFPLFMKDLRWQLIKEQVSTDNGIKIDDDDLLDAAKAQINAQFQQYYGAMQIPEEQLTQYAKEIVEKPEERRNLFETKLEEKSLEAIKSAVKLDTKEVTAEEFNALFK